MAICFGDNPSCHVQELLIEHLVERAYQRMLAERRDSIHYDDVGESCNLVAFACSLTTSHDLAESEVCAFNAATAVSKWPATDFLRGEFLSLSCPRNLLVRQTIETHQLILDSEALRMLQILCHRRCALAS